MSLLAPSCIGGSTALLYHTQYTEMPRRREPKKGGHHAKAKKTAGYLAAEAILKQRAGA